MDEKQLVAILAAIIFAGADDNQRESSYGPKSAVRIAREILNEAHEPSEAEAASQAESK